MKVLAVLSVVLLVGGFVGVAAYGYWLLIDIGRMRAEIRRLDADTERMRRERTRL